MHASPGFILVVCVLLLCKAPQRKTRRGALVLDWASFNHFFWQLQYPSFLVIFTWLCMQLGSGAGRHDLFLQRHFDVTEINISPGMLEMASSSAESRTPDLL
jgi:hypothetical protein